MPGGTWTFPAEAACVSAARQRVSAYAETHSVPEPPLEDIKLAVTEAVTNAVVHAYRKADKPGTFTLSIDVTPRESVRVTVVDHGGGMAPRIDSPGLGLGLGLIGALATSSEVTTPSGGGTEIRMTFALTG